MSRCINCGRELVTGDVYWDIELCDHCFLSVFADVTIGEKSINSICLPNVQDYEQIRQENSKLKETIAKWENGEYVSSKTANKSFEKRDELFKEKDHRIAVLERALLNLSKDVRAVIKCFWKTPNELKREYIKQAEKEVEEKANENN